MLAPNSYSNIAEAGITSGNVWKNHYPTYSVSFVTKEDYLSFHEKMRDDVVEQRLLDAQRAEATSNFKSINQSIDKSLGLLKNAIALEHGKKQSVVLYGSYGIQKINEIYVIPRDNDSRAHALSVMVKSLERSSDSIKNSKYGLEYWTDLRDKHLVAWDLNKRLDGLRSILANRLQDSKQQAKEWQSRLRAHLKVTYYDNYKSVWRDFGFQVEKYR